VCGIAGIVRSSGLHQGDRRCLSRLQKLLSHRGPDGAGQYEDGHCGLVQTRLRLIGPAQMTLPVSSADGRFRIVYNGEVYNFAELRRELQRETPFALASDTEVVLAAYIRWGVAALRRFNGMFAFFIWDAQEHRGLAACCPLAIKPFFYHRSEEYFAFASEAGALVESRAVGFIPDGEAIAEALVAPYFSSVTRLPLAGIGRLAPGSWLELRDDRVSTASYFEFTHQRTPATNVEGLIEQVAQSAEQATAAALHADTPVGLFLSGGVDSSLLAALAQRYSTQPLPAWTISYAGEHTANYSQSLIVKSADLPFAERVAARHGCDHSVVAIDEERYEQALLRTLRTNDLICAWEQEVSQFLLAEAAATRVKAVMVGDAADETHFGYSFLLDPRRIDSPRRVIDFFGVAPLRRSFLDNPADYFTCKYRKFAEDRGYRWSSETEQRLAMSCLIYRLWLTRLMHNGDIHLMAHSVEGRVPFGDSGVLALAQMVPAEVGFRDGVEKWHLRRAAERFLDAEVAWRPKSALSKNLLANRTIHRHFVRAWRESGAFLEHYVDCDRVEQLALAVPESERETGICFRLLAVMTWFERFHGVAR
jgi:asparagine synthase (glutamine-hydrolysing)